MDDILIKIHKSYRWVVALCDKDLIGKKIEEGGRQLEISERFFNGDSFSDDELKIVVSKCVNEDSTFYIVGENSVSFAKDFGIIEDEGIMRIEGIPFALVLL